MATARQEARVVLTAEDKFSATYAAFKRNLQQGNGLIESMSSRLGVLGLGLGSLGAGVSVAGAFGWIKTMADDIDQLNDSSDAVGDTVENISALEDVARRNGGNLDLVTTSLLKLNKVLNEATPDSPLERALRAIGLSAEDLRNTNPAAALQQVAVALNGYANDGNKARLMQELFGKSTRDMSAFLKDLAEAGQLNAATTTEQAAAAERFNKQLAGMATNVGNLSRALSVDLIAGINEAFARWDALKASFGSGWAGILAGVTQPTFRDAAAGVAHYTDAITKLDAELAGLPYTDAVVKKRFAARREEMQKFLDFYSRVAGPLRSGGPDRVNPDAPGLPSVGKIPDPRKPVGASPQVTEAERMLEALRKQAEGYSEMSAQAKLLADIDAGRIAGLTPALEKQLRAAAQAADSEAQRKAEAAQLVDLAKALNTEKEREAGFQRLIADKNQRDIDDVLAQLADTQQGKAEKAERQIGLLRDMLNGPAVDADRSTQILEVIERIQAGLGDAAAQGKTEFDKLADTIEKSMDRATDAVLDFVVEGKGGADSLFKAFARDVLRSQIEQPLRDTMRAASKAIADELGKIGQGGGIGGLISGAFSWLGGLFGGGGGSRANGGSVTAGGIYRVNENGQEWFSPATNGTILSAAQTRSSSRAAPTVHYAPVVHVNGDVSPQTVAMVQAMLARNNQQLLRSMRTNGAFAA